MTILTRPSSCWASFAGLDSAIALAGDLDDQGGVLEAIPDHVADDRITGSCTKVYSPLSNGYPNTAANGIRELAPYLGMAWTRRRTSDSSATDIPFLIGVRAWS